MKFFNSKKNLVVTGIILPLIIIIFGLILTYSGITIAEEPEYLTILHTNDVHGRLEPFQYKDKKNFVGGLARRAELIEEIESANKHVITVDAGDIAQGTLFFNIFSGTPDVKLMYLAGYDVATLGNHEFDKGLKVTKEIVKQSKFPFVCANIRFTEDEELQSMVRPYIIRERYGLKVAIIGLITRDLKILANNLDDVEIFDPVKTARDIVQKINSKADLIIALTHQGVSEDVKLAESVPEIDVIVGGHSHTLIKQPKLFNENGDKTLVIQAGEYGVYLGRLDISVKDKEIQNYYYSLIPVNKDINPDAYIKSRIKILAKKIGKYKNKKIGKLNFTIGAGEAEIRSALLKTGSLVTEAIKYRFPDVDIVLQNSGGIRLQKRIGPGEITLADVIGLYPFENTAVTLELQGSDLKSILETSLRRYPNENGGFLQSIGLEYTLDPGKPYQVLSDDGLKIVKKGQRVSDIKINGEPLENDKYYKVAINDYMFNGGNGYSQFKRAVNVTDTGFFVQELIINFIQENSPVSVEVQDRINIK